MKNNIYYKVQTFFWRKSIENKLMFLINNGDLNDAFQISTEIFADVNPLIAREKAFNYFQSIVDVMYEGINKNYISDFEARKDLQLFFNSGNDFELKKTGLTPIIISDDIYNGVFVYFVTKEPNAKIENKIQIHSINYLNENELLDEEIINSLKGLISEYKILKENNLICESNLIDFKEIGGEKTNILWTPFDWNLFVIKNNGSNLFR